MLRNAARRAVGRVVGASPSLAVRGTNDVNAAASWATTASALGDHLGSATAARWFAKRAGKPRVGSRGGEKSKALQPVAQAWTGVVDVDTGKTYWQGGEEVDGGGCSVGALTLCLPAPTHESHAIVNRSGRQRIVHLTARLRNIVGDNTAGWFVNKHNSNIKVDVHLR